MHVVLGFLGTVVTILWLLHRLAEMGIDLGGLNPFLWHRRRKWRKHYDANPIFKIDTPLDATALLITAIAKSGGDMSSEEKHEILSIFENEFHLSKTVSAELLISSSHLLGKGEEVRNNLDGVLSPSINNFSPEQAQSAIGLIDRISNVGGAPNDMQQQLVNNATNILGKVSEQKGKWD